LKEDFAGQAHQLPHIPNDGLPLTPTLMADTPKTQRELSMRFRTLEETGIKEADILFRLEAASKVDMNGET